MSKGLSISTDRLSDVFQYCEGLKVTKLKYDPEQHQLKAATHTLSLLGILDREETEFLNTTDGLFITMEEINNVIQLCRELIPKSDTEDTDSHQLYAATHTLNLLGIHIPGVNTLDINDQALANIPTYQSKIHRQIVINRIGRGDFFSVIDIGQSYRKLAVEMKFYFECVNIGDGIFNITFNPSQWHKYA
ncbi:hypothetical protein [Paenibacillus sp. Leaf72]|uniref:hypothetical protein n=1 Tax=Paenibacillus sp. Leaf72 TaxID=1736234 RepID=UPI0006F4C9A9|nr:hypothetical protein [Paenibacillus sp. Leaf72]KQN96994.1 hypothetical protein ASF12_23280 [Paenibacillus sp. Leaf72]